MTEEWCSDAKDRQKNATKVIRDWLTRGLAPHQITVLSPQSLESSTLGSIDRAKLPRQIVDVSHSGTSDTGRIRFSTIAGFKGLEADAVLLTDLDDLMDAETRSLMYVGASRANVLLALLLNEGCREQYNGRALELVGRLVGHRSEGAESGR